MSNVPTHFDELTPWQKADYWDLELHLRTTTPLQRLEWLERAFNDTLQMALERRAKGLVTLDGDGCVWPTGTKFDPKFSPINPKTPNFPASQPKSPNHRNTFRRNPPPFEYKYI